MSHYGVYLGGLHPTPGVERTAPPRPEDRYRDGGKQRAALAALAHPGTVAEVAARLGWDYFKAESWVFHLVRTARVHRVGWVRSRRGQKAGRYQVVTP